MHNVTDAKRAAALKTCILLHKLGELDDNLIPKKCEIVEEDVQFLFTHYPPVSEPMAGTHANRRMHNKKVSGVSFYCKCVSITINTLYFRFLMRLKLH